MIILVDILHDQLTDPAVQHPKVSTKSSENFLFYEKEFLVSLQW